MEGLKQFIVSIVEQTIQSLHDRGLLLVSEGDEEKAARMFGGKLELSMNDLRQHPACGWSRKKTIKLLRDKHIEDLGTSARDYRISAVSVYRFLTKEKISQTEVDMNRPPAHGNETPSAPFPTNLTKQQPENKIPCKEKKKIRRPRNRTKPAAILGIAGCECKEYQD